MITIANFVTILFKLTGLADYYFSKIYIKSTLALIIYYKAVFTTKGILNTLTLPQTTNMNEITKKTSWAPKP